MTNPGEVEQERGPLHPGWQPLATVLDTTAPFFEKFLSMGIRQMEGYKKKIGILLTDGDWTYGGDPLHVAQRFDTLHVIGLEEPASSEAATSEQVSRQYYSSRVEMIAKEGRGQFSYVRSIEEVPLAITRCLTA